MLHRSISTGRRHIDRPKAAGEFVVLQPFIQAAANGPAMIVRDTLGGINEDVHDQLCRLAPNHYVYKGNPRCDAGIVYRGPDGFR